MYINQLKQNYGRSMTTTTLFVSAMEEDEDSTTTKTTTATTILNDKNETNVGYNKTLESVWNIPGMKKEVDRLIMRMHKKIGKANLRLSKAQTTVKQLLEKENATLKELNACPNVDSIQLEYQAHQIRLGKLQQLQEMLQSLKKGSNRVLPLEVATLALELNVNDERPPREPRGAKKVKNRVVVVRLPYRRYYTKDNVEIRVGKKAIDNDALSCSPQHRDPSDWWMHASGCPGSHVVIRHADPTREVLLDAAALAARHSKCNQSGTIRVTLCQCRNISKPSGAKPGLVQIQGGAVKSISIHMKREAESRLERLDQTVLVN